MPDHKRTTSERHTGLIEGYRDGSSPFKGWAFEKLGNIEIKDWSWGQVKLHWAMDDRFIMPDGVMFGGHIAAVSDHIVALGTMTVLTHNEERFRTSRLETNFFRPLTKPYADIDVRVTNASKTLVHVEADFINAKGKLAVRAQAVQVRRQTGAIPGEEQA